MSSVPPDAVWGPSAALAAGRGGLARQSDSSAQPPVVLRGKSFIGFMNEAALDTVCGVATADSNNNKKVDKVLDGICIKENCQAQSHLNCKRSSKFTPGWYAIRKYQSRTKDVYMRPRGFPELADLHEKNLLNLVVKDLNTARIVFDRLSKAKTTDEGVIVTRELSMDKTFGNPKSDDGMSYDSSSDGEDDTGEVKA